MTTIARTTDTGNTPLCSEGSCRDCGRCARVLRVSVYRYPDGFDGHAVTVGAPLLVPSVRPRRAGVWREIPEAEREARDAANKARSVRRSVQSLRRLIRACGFDTLGTLTIGGDRLPSDKAALDLAAEFIASNRAVRDALGPVVFVVEHGSEHGRVHLHFGCRLGERRIDYDAFREAWSRYLEARGYRSRTGSHRVHFSRHKGYRRLANYLAKYLGKGLGDGLPVGAHRYRAFDAAAPAPAFVGYLPPDFHALAAVLGLEGVTYGTLHAPGPDGLVPVGWWFRSD